MSNNPTPAEKARELYQIYYTYCQELYRHDKTKQCAIFAVTLLIKHLPSSQGNPPNLQEHEGNKEYWEYVIYEITAL